MHSEKITGTFEGILITKEGVSDKTGKPWKAYAVMVDGNKYSAGFNPVKAAVGDYVEFLYGENDRGHKEMGKGSFRVVKGGGGAPASPQKAPSGSAGQSPSEASRQSSIETQCALKAAVEVVAALITSGEKPSSPSAAVASLTKDFVGIIRGGSAPEAPKQAPKPTAPAPDVFEDDPTPF